MKVTVLLFSICAVFGTSLAVQEPHFNLAAVPYQQRIFENVINSTINLIVTQIAKIDPVAVDSHALDLFGHHGAIENLHVEGFSNIVATEISLTGLFTWTLKLVIEAPKIRGIVKHWKVDGEMLFGDGDGSFEMDDFKLTITGKINPITISIKELYIQPSIGRAHVSITGIYNNEELSQKLCDYINLILNDIVNNSQWLHDIISKTVHTILNKIIGAILG